MKKGMTVALTEERNRAIISAVARRRSNESIAEEFDLSSRQVEEITQQWRETRPKLSQQDPVEIIEDMLAEYQAVMEELGEVAHTTTHDGTRVGAIGRRLKAMEQMQKLMQDTGTLPRDLGQLRVQLEVSVIADRFMEVLDAHDASPVLVAGLMKALRPDLALPVGEE